MKTRVMLCLLLAALTASPALADKRVGARSVAATNQHYKIDGEFSLESNAWSYVWTDLKTGQKRVGPLAKIKGHAGVYFFLSQDGRRFAVLDASFGHHLDNRFMVFTAEGDLIASLGVNDILTTDEQATVQRSESHLRWLKYDPTSRSYGKYLPAENAVGVTTLSDREVLISLADGKVIRKDK